MIAGSAGTYSEGNLKVVVGDGHSGLGTFMVDTGKWYFEILYISGSGQMGVCDKTHTSSDNFLLVNNAGNAYGGSDGGGGFSNNFASIGTVAANAIIGVALNCTDGEVTLYEDNVVIGSTQNVVTSDGMTPMLRGSDTGFTSMLNAGQDSSFAGSVTAQGNQDSNSIGDFYYEPPADFLALCSSNLPSPEIALPTDHFNTVLYTGNGSTNAITGVGFATDMVWNKSRSAILEHHLFDTVRGVTKYFSVSETDAEATDANSLTAFGSDGFTLGSSATDNQTLGSMVSWNWKAGGTAASNTDGSITSSVSANTTAGFSIVSYTGTGSTATVGHGLSSTPELLIVKNRSNIAGWGAGGINFYDGVTNWLYYMQLDTSGIRNGSNQFWNSTSPSSSVFTVEDASSVNTNTDNYIAYCFHSIEGYSKVSGYTAAGSDGDMNFLYCGFRPAFVLFKETSATQGWAIIDNKRNTYNLADLILRPNLSDAVYSHSSGVDFVSNGIKLRNNNGMWGDADAYYIFYAIAESPFKYSNAR